MWKFTRILFLLTSIFSASQAFSLIGGNVAEINKFTSVIQLNGCTAVKIHPRYILTAAHCIKLDSAGIPVPQSSMEIFFPQLDAIENFKVVNVNNIYIHKTWSTICSKMSCSGLEILRGHEDSTIVTKPDVALIELESDSLSEVGFIPLSTTLANVDDEVILTGYGCTEGIYTGKAPLNLQFKNTKIIPTMMGDHEGSLYREFNDLLDKSYFLTPGKILSDSSASICPGDSGGPVLRITPNHTYEVVGINADYTFNGEYEAKNSIPVTNIHTRLDDQSEHSVASWIRSYIK